MSSAAAAHWYANQGWPVFPCWEHGKEPLTTRGFKDASTDHGVIDKWWTQYPRANLALVSGKPSGWFALDVDGSEGAASLAELERVHGALPDTVEQTTARGRHLLFALPTDAEIKNSAGRLGPGLDIRADGGYIIVAPSVHPSGTPYRWKDGHKPSDRLPAAPPAWLIRLLQEKPSTSSTNNASNSSTNNASNNERSPYVQAALAGELGTLLAAREGHRNDALNRAAFNIGTLVGAGALELTHVRERLIAAALSIGLGRPETERTVDSGLEHGIANPREIPEAEWQARGSPSSMSPARAPTVADWPELDPAAEYGFIGRMLALIHPQTEADKVALIAQFLAAFGVAIGRFAYFAVEGDRHRGNLFIALVGETSKGRKGTSWGHVRALFERAADPGWPGRVASGLSTGEGLIHSVRDPVENLEPVKDAKTKKIMGSETVVVDGGEPDKRLLVVESELAGALKIGTREGNILSPILRAAWDGTQLRTLTKTSPVRCREPHIGVIGHITRAELLRHLSVTEAGNGLGNRFLWLCVRRSKALPDGGHIDEVEFQALIDELRATIQAIANIREVRRDAEASEIWRAVYDDLSEGKPGLLGAMIGRAEAQVTRLALLYALSDRSAIINGQHMTAALALWQFAEDSARFIFGDSMGDPLADAILAAIRSSAEGMTRTEISKFLGHHKSSVQIERALSSLAALQLIERMRHPTQGREAERWKALR